MNVFGRIRGDDRGAGYLAAVVVLFPTIVLAAAGLLIDTARLFAADRQASNVALEAARAAANQVVEESWKDGGGVIIDPGAAQVAAHAAASRFVSQSELSLTSVAVDGDRVTVTVSSSVRSWFPLVPSRTVSEWATAQAQLARGP